MRSIHFALLHHHTVPIGEPTLHGGDVKKVGAGAITATNVKIIIQLVVQLIIIESLLRLVANSVIA
jgi:hypothetical protein